MNPAKVRRQRALTWLVFLVAAVTLVESWFACVAAASEGGRPLPWLWPTTLEAFAITLILVAWDSLVEGRPAKLVRLLLLLTTSVMAAVQVLDAPADAGALGWITAAWTPIGLNLMVEVGVRLRYDAQRRATLDSPDAIGATTRETPGETRRATTDVAATETPAETRRAITPVAAASQLTGRDRRRIETRKARGMGGKDIARETGIPQRAVFAYLRELPTPEPEKVAANGGRP